MTHRRWFTPWLLAGPAILWLAVFNLWPAVNTVILSFTNAKPIGGGRFTGLENYGRLLDDAQLADALLNSIVFMLVCLPLLTVLPLLLALLVQRRIPGITFFRTAFYTPVIASAVVVALIWGWVLDDRGLVNGLLGQSGLSRSPVPFLTDRWLLLFSAIALTVWKGLGYYMVIYLSALANVPRELHEAAAVDGAGPLSRFRHVTLPGVRPTMVLISALISVSSLRVFSELYVLSNGLGGPGGRDMSVVMLIQMYSRGFNGHLGYASALSLLLFVVTLGPMLFLLRLNRKAA
ncbi:carbohydrate ABC transporter permease [Kitasatospora aureofaciens]|uniref:ABC transporter permease n=1 Tax=Kitasatospora aureofaciens TaxID=1894 RepID=A0A1E7MXH5_KITAU|nr:sugar ABC transporter permease [Kitasatospora aureofaciens]OEV33129.1 ABC transporter permease [Kitasatospora aureofaciens]QEV02765.1 sugar ABC transporter permease [Streptomyces viridifaciens]UKZ09366.1 sugar ABC transporter permease [Streptomyces viridifaciens]GGU56359.1 ABC transporter permease [Kitasatospora aureofaciens]